MRYRLRQGLHWCECAGRIVFLDLVEDRYSCLSLSSAEAFLRLAGDKGRADDPERLRPLILRGMLVDDRSAKGLQPPACFSPPSGDLFEEPYPEPPLHDLVRAVTAQASWGLLVRTRSLASIVNRLERRSRRCSGNTAAIERAGQLVSAFAAVSGILPPQDRCLVRALALHSLCCRNKIRPTLVFGVRMNPFRAHCWVELGGKVLVGDFEQARLFTPIAAFG